MSHSIIKSHAICNLSIVPVRAKPSDESEIVSQLLFGDYVIVLEKGTPWIKIKNNSDSYEGWIDFKQVTYINSDEFNLGLSNTQYIVNQPSIDIKSSVGKQAIFLGSVLPFLKNNSFKISSQVFEILSELTQKQLKPNEYAQLYLNTPYLWGGKSLHGIDCSGLIQNAFKSSIFSLPRDASQQVNIGDHILWENRAIDDVVFFKSKSGNVTHVGILTSKDTIIHAHGKVRIDKIDTKGIWNSELDWYSHLTFCVKRFL